MLLPAEVPVMTLNGAILFPQAMLPLYIFEPRYRKMLQEALETHRMFAIAMQKPHTKRESPAQVAGLGLIRAAVKNSDGTSHLILQGVCRLKLGKVKRYRPYRVHEVKPIETTGNDSVAVDALTVKLLDLVAERFAQGKDYPPQIVEALKKVEAAENPGDPPTNTPAENIVKYLSKVQNPDHLADLVSCTLLPTPLQRQQILETANLEARLKFLIHFLIAEIQQGNQ
ncbi:MAG TPA: LON peptidase substrate-binding domain-containing protein [Verrucomicrobiae bacterium]|nr:LON peptidase substrate-binding domain-containing protein [Verrucomicrobiae bacterium]